MEFYELKHVDYINRPAVQKVIDFLKDNDLTEQSLGIHEVDEDFFYNVISYATTTEDERPWENHHQYIDIHVPIKGFEKIAHAFVSEVELKDYVEEEDFQQSIASPSNYLTIKPGQILVLDSYDVHKTGLIVSEPKMIKKAVFKVKYK